MVRVRGSYALAVMFKDYPGQIYAARKDSPMIIGVGEGETYLASDVPAILQYCRSVYYIGNLEDGEADAREAVFYNIDGDVIEKAADGDHLGRRVRGKGRLRALHAQGDP